MLCAVLLSGPRAARRSESELKVLTMRKAICGTALAKDCHSLVDFASIALRPTITCSLSRQLLKASLETVCEPAHTSPRPV